MRALRKTKIVATIGPKTESFDALIELMNAGVDVCRINCSHSSPDKIRRLVATIRRAASAAKRSVGILLDLQGPKIRTGVIDPPLLLKKGDTLRIVMDENYAHHDRTIGTTWPNMSTDVKSGEKTLFADGALAGVVSNVILRDDRPDIVEIKMTVGGTLGSRKGINLPESNIQAPALTAKDEVDLKAGVLAGVDYVALSFVRHADDMKMLKERLIEHNRPDLPTIAKIEKPQGVENIDEILENGSGIMVARGDLGVEIPIAQVPMVQKKLIKAANRKGKLVITATQMLESMTNHPFPTRAEVTDVANAILDGTDAVMLSGETSVGKYPEITVQTMAEIALQTEKEHFDHSAKIQEIEPLQGKYQSVVRAACYAAQEDIRPMVVFTWSGKTAILASKTRPPQPIFAISPNSAVVDMLRIAWGVYAIKVPQIQSTAELIAETEKALMQHGLLNSGDEVVILGGNAPLRGASNLMKIEIIGQDDQ